MQLKDNNCYWYKEKSCITEPSPTFSSSSWFLRRKSCFSSTHLESWWEAETTQSTPSRCCVSSIFADLRSLVNYFSLTVQACVAYLPLQGQLLLQVLDFGFIPENVCLKLFMGLKQEQNRSRLVTVIKIISSRCFWQHLGLETHNMTVPENSPEAYKDTLSDERWWETTKEVPKRGFQKHTGSL